MSGRGRGADGPTGLVVVDKEPGWTSHDVVAKLRRLYGQRRTGHAGTLDPDATGVLLVGLGRATRLLRFLQGAPKTYEGTFALGSTTTTLDAAGEVTARFDMGHVHASDVEAAAQGLTGDLMQVPPMVSALKVQGRRLHELARQGIEVEREARPVTIERFDVAPTDDPSRYSFEVVCSSGTYIRSLVDDLGRDLGGGAHLVELRRTAVGSFGIAEARTLSELAALAPDPSSGSSSAEAVLTPAQAMRDLEQVVVGADVAELISKGLGLDRVSVGAGGEGPYGLVDDRGQLLAVYEATETDRIVPAVVLAAR